MNGTIVISFRIMIILKAYATMCFIKKIYVISEDIITSTSIIHLKGATFILSFIIDY